MFTLLDSLPESSSTRYLWYELVHSVYACIRNSYHPELDKSLIIAAHLSVAYSIILFHTSVEFTIKRRPFLSHMFCLYIIMVILWSGQQTWSIVAG